MSKNRRFADVCEIDEDTIEKAIKLVKSCGVNLTINLLKLDLKIGRVKAALILDELEFRGVIKCDEDLNITDIVI